MFKRFFMGMSWVVVSLCSTAVVAQATPPVVAAAAAASSEDAKLAAVKKLFAERFNNPPIAGVRSTPYGLYEVQLGSDLVYTDEQVSFVLDGTLIDAKTRRDITRERQDELAKVPFEQLDSTQKVKNIWCAKDQGETWDAWMLKGVVPPTVNCDVPVDKMVALGQKLMVRGTPAIFFADGSRVGGAIPKEEIEKRLK